MKYKVIVGKHVFRAPVSQDYKKKVVLANYPRQAAGQRFPIRESGTALFSGSVTLQQHLKPTIGKFRESKT